MNGSNNPLARLCLNPKVLGALAVVAVLMLVLAPGAALSVLPLLLLAACPLSMLLMGGMMIGARHGQHEETPSSVGRRAIESPDKIAALQAEVAALRERLDENDEAVLPARERGARL